jgi:hypothetical protein
MNKISYLILSGLLFSLQPAYAQDVALDDCTCITESTDSTTLTLGNISSSIGNVLYSSDTGFERAIPGVQLVSGSQITVGINAAAVISVGVTCNLPIPANSEVAITQPAGPGGKICVKVSTDPVVAATPSPLIPALAIGGIIGIDLVFGGGNDPASN